MATITSFYGALRHYGIKTGYTGASGFNLVAATERNGVRLISVVFGGRSGASRDAHMMKSQRHNFAV